LGFAQRWARTAPAAACFLVLGLVLIGLDTPGKHASVNLVGAAMTITGLAVFIFIGFRLFAVWRVAADPSGLSWSGLWGSRCRTWDDIAAVYRTERITNGQTSGP
jgi:hypothetical protein